MEYSCVVVAAGSGTRSGLPYNKVLHKITDKTIIEESIQHFENDRDCRQIIIVISKDELDTFQALDLSSKVEFAFGGSRRQDSVLNGLSKVSMPYVMIHDGARPFVTQESIERLKAALLDYNAALLMVPSIDTSKLVVDNVVKSTLVRSTVYNAQTPQAFKTSVLIAAYNNLVAQNLDVTDDAEVVELMSNEMIKVVEGDYKNIKITTVEDL